MLSVSVSVEPDEGCGDGVRFLFANRNAKVDGGLLPFDSDSFEVVGSGGGSIEKFDLILVGEDPLCNRFFFSFKFNYLFGWSVSGFGRMLTVGYWLGVPSDPIKDVEFDPGDFPGDFPGD